MKVDALFIKENALTGLECSECGQRFFDRMSEGFPPRILESGVQQFIEHAEEAHQSSGGVIGAVRKGAAA